MFLNLTPTIPKVPRKGKKVPKGAELKPKKVGLFFQIQILLHDEVELSLIQLQGHYTVFHG